MSGKMHDMASIVRIKEGAASIDKHVTDPVMAHFFGLIQAAPISMDSLVASMSSLLDRDAILTKLQYFEALGIVEITASTGTRREKKTMYPVCEKCPKRDYSGFTLNETDLAEEVELTPEMKQEVIFLYHYGPNLNYYKILNIASDATDDEVSSAHYAMLDLFDPKYYAGKKLGSYGQKMAIVRKVIEKTVLLCDPEKRKRYDGMVFGRDTAAKDPERIRRAAAADHFANALILSKKERAEDTERALREISSAIDLEPDNEEFKTTRQKLEKIHRKNKMKKQLSLIEQLDFDLFEGQRLREEVAKVLDLGEHTAEIYFAVAELMVKKGYLLIAKKMVRQSMQLDTNYTRQGNQLIEKIEQILDYYKKFGQTKKEEDKDYEL